jgi:hypothetical protein
VNVRWKTSWPLLKDVGLTGTGIAVILLQAFSAKPNGLLLGTGLALTVPSTWDHIKALLPSSAGGSGAESSSPSSVSGGPPPSPLPSREEPGE